MDSRVDMFLRKSVRCSFFHLRCAAMRYFDFVSRRETKAEPWCSIFHFVMRHRFSVWIFSNIPPCWLSLGAGSRCIFACYFFDSACIRGFSRVQVMRGILRYITFCWSCHTFSTPVLFTKGRSGTHEFNQGQEPESMCLDCIHFFVCLCLWYSRALFLATGAER